MVWRIFFRDADAEELVDVGAHAALRLRADGYAELDEPPLSRAKGPASCSAALELPEHLR